GQRAIVAARALPQFEATKKRGPKCATDSGTSRGRATDDAAKVFKVGVNAVQQAKALLAEAPDLAAQVEARLLTITDAYKQFRGRQAERERKERQMAEIAEYRLAVENEEMTFEEAMSLREEKIREEKDRERRDAEAHATFFSGLAGLVEWAQTSV